MKHAVLGALASLGLTSLGLVSTASAGTITVPSRYANVEGSSDALIMSHADTHMQLQFKASNFGAGPVTFGGLSFRYDRQVSDFYQPIATFNFGSSFNVELATATHSLADRSLTYAANLGSDLTTVMSGAQTVTAAVGGASGQLKSFGITFNFANAFTYDPTAGDLVLDMFLPNVNQFADMDYVPDSSALGIIFSNGSAASVGPGGMALGGPVTQFMTIPNPIDPGGVLNPPGGGVGGVPEPASWALMIAGFAGVGAVLRRRIHAVAA